MLKKMLIILGVASMFSTSAFAAEELNYYVTDYTTGRIKVYGNTSRTITDRFVGLTVFKAGVNPDTVPDKIQENNFIQYQTQTGLSDDGYSVNLLVNPLQSDEPYTVMVSVNGSAYTLPLYFYSESVIDAYIDELNSKEPENMSDNELKEECDKLISTFSANGSEAYSDYYDLLSDKAEIAKIFLRSANKSLVKDAGYESIKKLIDSSIVCAAYNHSLTNGELAYSDLFGFDKDTYSYNLYKNAMTADGAATVVRLMTGNTSVADILTNFKKQTIYSAVNYPLTYGYGHITDILNNSTAANTLVSLGFNQSVYENSNKTEVAKQVYNNPKSDIQSLVDYINEVAKANPKTTGGGGGGGSSSGGGGSSNKGGNSTPAINLPVVNTTETEIKYEEVFNDLGGVEWAKRAIMALYKSGAISGMDENTFAPSENITREQFVKILVCAMNIEPSDEELTFDDVDKNMWYYPYVSAAVKKGIVFGISETEFGVGEYITREQIAAMCSRVINKTSDKIVEDFADNADISEYAYDSVMLMKKLGVINGNESGEFKPKDYATRAEVAQIVYGIVNL